MLTRGCAPQNGATALYIAAQNGYLAVVGVLVEAKADMTAKNNVSEGRCKATWERQFKLPWRKAGLLQSSR